MLLPLPVDSLVKGGPSLGKLDAILEIDILKCVVISSVSYSNAPLDPCLRPTNMAYRLMDSKDLSL